MGAPGRAAGADRPPAAALPASSAGRVAVADLVRGRVARGLTARLPDMGPWRRALAAVREGRYRQAAERFRLAGAQLRQLASPCDDAGRGCDGRLSRAEVRRLVRLAALAEEDAHSMQV